MALILIICGRIFKMEVLWQREIQVYHVWYQTVNVRSQIKGLNLGGKMVCSS